MELNSDLARVFAQLEPQLATDPYAFVSIPDGITPEGCSPLATFREREGLTLVLTEAEATALRLKPMLVVAWIALSVETELDAVGITALIASAFAVRDLPCNVMAGAYHDHVFVPVARADEAMSVLAGLQAEARIFFGAS